MQNLPEATPQNAYSMAPLDEYPHQGHRGLLIQANTDLEVRAEPGGVAFARLSGTLKGQPLWLPVVDQQPGWVQVLLPGRTRGATGWLDAERVTTGYSRHEIHVHLRDRQLNLAFSGRLARGWHLEIASGTDHVPIGRTFVLAVAPDETQPGRRFLQLAAHTTHQCGAVTIAIAAGAGHGNLAIPASALPVLARVPLGALVRIHP
ncbi:hypothetical protein [Actinoplanes sp. NPDC026619]|uniref:hypothetical protein n=1 Tax=Actinoplanes sp. NPDC026619 TaxID=3155798 RepID=UPI003408FA20